MPDTLLFTGSDVARVLPLADCIDAVAAAFGALGRGEAEPPATLAVHASGGGFHIKAGILSRGGRRYFAAKTNGNFPGNPARHGLPTIQGVLLLSDADDGRVLAVMDSVELTALRTAAATAVAARHLARRDAHSALVCGCGVQGRVQLRALHEVLPLTRVYAHDVDAARARAYASDMQALLGIEVDVVSDVATGIAAADVIVTCTTSTEYFVTAAMLRPGLLIAGVGVDNEVKRELAPDVLRGADKVVTDVREQCARIGDLHHALDAGVMTLADVYADLGDVVAGNVPARERDDETIVFDSTGIALQDVAAAAAIYERARGDGAAAVRGISFS